MKKVLRVGRMITLFVLIASVFACQKDLMMSDAEMEASVDSTLLTSKTDSVHIIDNFDDSTQLATLLATTAIEKANYYVAPNGSDNNPGTIDKPFKTWIKAINAAAAGNLIYLRGGTYPTDLTKLDAIIIKKSGASGKRIRLWAYPGEKPVLKGGGKNISGIRFEGNYWHFKGFEITGLKETQGKVTRGFISVNSSNNIYELLNIHHNGGPAFAINHKSGNNLVINCDFHNNYDVLNKGENADGMSIAYIPRGYTNKIRGCRFWNNSDDGVDLWRNEGVVYVDSCWSWNNGYVPGTQTACGNGQGFKFGKTDLAPDAKAQRIVRNCKAFFNRSNGFDQNNGNIIMDFRYNVAYKNKRYGFYFYTLPLKHVLVGNIAIDNFSASKLSSQYVVNKECTQKENTWQQSITSSSIFASLDSKGVSAARKADGSLPYTTFLKVK